MELTPASVDRRSLLKGAAALGALAACGAVAGNDGLAARTALADEAAGRNSDTSTRPLFQNLEAARARCEERLPLYEAVADVRVSTAGKSVPAIAREVQRILEKEGILCPQQR